MASNIDPNILDGLSYVVWASNMEILLKSKGFYKDTKTTILYMLDD